MQLVSGLLTLLDTSMAKGSWATYQRAINTMTKFLKEFSIAESLPLSPIILAFFITHLYNLEYAASTIQTYVSAVGYVHRLHGKADPTNNFIVKRAIQGAKKDRTQGDIRLPITNPILNKRRPPFLHRLKIQVGAVH